LLEYFIVWHLIFLVLVVVTGFFGFSWSSDRPTPFIYSSRSTLQVITLFFWDLLKSFSRRNQNQNLPKYPLCPISFHLSVIKLDFPYILWSHLVK